MYSNQTLVLIKPDAVSRHCIGEILGRLEAAGFAVTGLVMRRLSREQAGEFYAIHRDKEFFPGLVEFMTSGPLVAVRLTGEDACRRVREFVGSTDPAKAAPGTIRADFGTSVRTNAVHASNPEEDVRRELEFFFPEAGDTRR
ncbi:nucleoside-diphosphate kinase [candidate division WOR-3 bacterium]|nr:nucleoside-diphosphate kinase [candidate division WOR-3 bacterium]